MSGEWSLDGANSELVDRTDVAEKVLQVPLTMKMDEKTIDAMRERVAKHFSAVKVKFLTIGAPKPEDVKIGKKELKYVPFWRVLGTYACRYVRRASYALSVSDDVEEVKIYGRLQQLRGQRRKLSDAIAEVGATAGIGYGPVKVSLAPLQGAMKAGLQKVLSSKDKDLGRQAELNLTEAEELVSYAIPVGLCFNASSQSEDRKMFDALQNVSNFELLSRDVREKSKPVVFTKDDVRNELKKVAVKEPDVSPSRIIEQEIGINKLELIYVPFYDLKVEAKDQTKTIELNVLTGEDYAL